MLSTAAALSTPTTSVPAADAPRTSKTRRAATRVSLKTLTVSGMWGWAERLMILSLL